MKNAMTYKDYAVRVAFDPHDRVIAWAVWRAFEILSSSTAGPKKKLEAAFKEAVDHYVDTCAKLGDGPVDLLLY